MAAEKNFENKIKKFVIQKKFYKRWKKKVTVNILKIF